MSEPILEVEDLTIQYKTSDGMVSAVSDASFTILENEYFGLVGESGSGKSTIAKSIVGGLAKNGQITSGRITYDGRDLVSMSDTEYNDTIRWKEISYIPQGSMSSLDPLQRLDKKVLEVARTHADISDEEAIEKFCDMLEVVGLSEDRLYEYPHQFSGGMKQRIIIALALYLEPSLIIADEPTTALDVIMQDQIFKYLQDIKEQFDTSLLLITHDISLVFESCNSAAVLHAGQVAETGLVTSIYDAPQHPYTVMLTGAFPDFRYPEKELSIIGGNPPQMTGAVTQCTYASRCPLATDECWDAAPRLEEPAGATDSDDARHRVSCFHIDKIDQLHSREDNITSHQQ